MKFIHTFESFDPRLNEIERPDATPPDDYMDSKREIQMRPDEIKFDALAYDDSDYALLRLKSNGDFYLLNGFANDPEEFYPYQDIPYDTEDDGSGGFYKNYNYDLAEVDDQAVATYATELFNSNDPKNVGIGYSALEDGTPLIKIDADFARVFIQDLFDTISHASSGSGYSNKTENEIRELRKIISILSKNFPTQ
jgi:hypothetical protein